MGRGAQLLPASDLHTDSKSLSEKKRKKKINALFIISDAPFLLAQKQNKI